MLPAVLFCQMERRALPGQAARRSRPRCRPVSAGGTEMTQRGRSVNGRRRADRPPPSAQAPNTQAEAQPGRSHLQDWGGHGQQRGAGARPVPASLCRPGPSREAPARSGARGPEGPARLCTEHWAAALSAREPGTATPLSSDRRRRQPHVLRNSHARARQTGNETRDELNEGEAPGRGGQGTETGVTPMYGHPSPLQPHRGRRRYI